MKKIIEQKDDEIWKIADDIPDLTEREKEIIYKLFGITMIFHLTVTRLIDLIVWCY